MTLIRLFATPAPLPHATLDDLELSKSSNLANSGVNSTWDTNMANCRPSVSRTWLPFSHDTIVLAEVPRCTFGMTWRRGRRYEAVEFDCLTSDRNSDFHYGRASGVRHTGKILLVSS